jgi:hypothetical protein
MLNMATADTARHRAIDIDRRYRAASRKNARAREVTIPTLRV